MRDPRRAWYLGGVPGLGGDPDETAKGIRRLLATRGAKPSTIVAVGSSMGGFGAILLASLLGADHALAVVPQAFLGPGRLKEISDGRFAPHYRTVSELIAAREKGAAYADLAPLLRSLGERCRPRVLVASRDAAAAAAVASLKGAGGVDAEHARLDAVHAAHVLDAAGECATLVSCDPAAAHDSCARAMRDDGSLAAALRERLFPGG